MRSYANKQTSIAKPYLQTQSIYSLLFTIRKIKVVEKKNIFLPKVDTKVNKMKTSTTKTIANFAIVGVFLMSNTITAIAQEHKPKDNKPSSNSLIVRETIISDTRPVVARLESSDTSTARARIPGIITSLRVDEGDVVKKGQTIAIIRDESLDPQINSLSSKINGIEKKLAQLKIDLARAEKLFTRGFVSPAKIDQARTAVEVTEKELSGLKSQRAALIAQKSKGVVTAPSDARITEVKVVKGASVSPGEVIAKLATLDGVVRLSLPERHAGAIREGEIISLRLPARGGATRRATITKVYPELRGGNVIADAVVEGGLQALVGERVDVLVPVGERRALRIHKDYITTRYGIDFVRVHIGEHVISAPVTLSNPQPDLSGYVEILAGLKDGDVIELPTTKIGE